ncbi:hypothetical protein DL93DRAFT_2229829 [Clavulina sp. PMI_390]|nr:hypothetical protein DL93DRAFT_2229829 [Clavulina sp. PMI_390]
MLAPQSLWTSVERSHKALFESISSDLKSSRLALPPHLLSVLPSLREQASAALYRDRARISECRERIRAAQKSFDEMDALCAFSENTLNMCIQPIGALPFELIRRIFHFAIESPHQHQQIIQLSGVSRAWRSTVLSMSDLFIAPKWTWAAEMLESWISRSSSHPLHVYISLSDEDRSNHVLHGISMDLVPHISRVQVIHVEGRGYFKKVFPASFRSIFQEYPLPLLEDIVFHGWNSLQLYVSVDRAPQLRRLHSFGIAICVPQRPLRLQSLGIKVYDARDLGRAINIARLQANPFHLSIYAHPLTHVKESLLVAFRPADCWVHVTSLRLYRFSEKDKKHIGSLVSQLVMPNLVSLELVELDHEVFVEVLRTMPESTNTHIERLLITSCDYRHPDFISPLNEVKKDGHDRKQVFPNLRELIVRDPAYVLTSKLSNDFLIIKAFVESRRGTLEQLILPSILQPQPSDPEVTEYSNRALSFALTSDEESTLQVVGDLAQASGTTLSPERWDVHLCWIGSWIDRIRFHD